MAKYRITVEGEGPVGTADRDHPLDADRLLARFRADLEAGGHKVASVALEEVADEPAEEGDDEDGDDNEVTGTGRR